MEGKMKTGRLIFMAMVFVVILGTTPVLACMTHGDVSEGMNVRVHLSDSSGQKYVVMALQEALNEEMNQHRLKEMQITKIKQIDVFITLDWIEIVTYVMNPVEGNDRFRYKEKFHDAFHIDPNKISGLITEAIRIPMKKFFIRALLNRSEAEAINLKIQIATLLLTDKVVHTAEKNPEGKTDN